MLTGEYRHALDPKNRFFVPSKHREELADNFVIARSFRKKCLIVYSQMGWGAYMEPIEKQNGKLKEEVLRFLNSTAQEATPDKQGRVVLSEGLIQYAGIDRDIVVVGCGTHDEIWSAEAYDAYMKELDVNALCKELEFYGL